MMKPGAPFPKQNVPHLGGDTLTVGAPRGGYDWQLIVVYRGLHCPLCKTYLTQLEALQSRFHDNGIDVIALLSLIHI